MEKLVKVECYAGYKGDERPAAFVLDERSLRVDEIVDRWYDVDYNYYKVVADDGGSYLLRHDLNSDGWELVDQKG